MSTIVLSIAILMIAALLIGFAIGWFIRRTATRDRYEKEIDRLTLEDDRITSELQINSVNYENAKKHLDYLEGKSLSQKQQIVDYKNKTKELTSDIEQLKSSKIKLENEIKELNKEIENSSNELSTLKSQEETFKGSINKIEDFEEKIKIKKSQIDEISSKISDLMTQRDSLNGKIQNLNENIALLDKDIELENVKIKEIEDEFEIKKSRIIKDVNLTREKALNYKYALNYINEKIASGEKVTADTIDKIISKNEETKLFANLIKKLFGKSAKYIKEGK